MWFDFHRKLSMLAACRWCGSSINSFARHCLNSIKRITCLYGNLVTLLNFPVFIFRTIDWRKRQRIGVHACTVARVPWILIVCVLSQLFQVKKRTSRTSLASSPRGFCTLTVMINSQAGIVTKGRQSSRRCNKKIQYTYSAVNKPYNSEPHNVSTFYKPLFTENSRLLWIYCYLSRQNEMFSTTGLLILRIHKNMSSTVADDKTHSFSLRPPYRLIGCLPTSLTHTPRILD